MNFDQKVSFSSWLFSARFPSRSNDRQNGQGERERERDGEKRERFSEKRDFSIFLRFIFITCEVCLSQQNI